ncbi:MAG: diguanylate cyclase [Clostridiales bacterium]
MKFKKSTKRILYALVITIVTVFIIWDFSIQLNSALTKETYLTLSEVSEDYNKAFLDRISYNTKTLKVLGGSLEALSDGSKEKIMGVLQNAVDDGGFTEVIACDVNGMGCSNHGEILNLANRDYFAKAMDGETNISEPLRSVIDGKQSIVIAVPIKNVNSVQGVVLGVYPLSTAGSQLLNFTYYSDGYGFVIAPDGTIILSSNHADKLANEENLFSFFAKTEFKDFSVAQLQAAIKNGESKSFEFNYNGERRFVSFIPSTVNDWYTFSISSDALLLQQEKVTNQIVIRLLLMLGLAVVLILGLVFLRKRRHNNEILKANQKYQSLLSHINGGMIVAKHSKTADGTIVTYVSSGFTDMTGYTLEDIHKLFNGRYLNVILEDDRDNVFAIYLNQLAEGNTYYMPYRIRKKDGSLLWVMDNGYLVEDDDGLHNHSIITDIAVIKQQEEELRLSENRFSIAINASSGTLFEVDLKKQLFTHFENAERIFGVKNEKLISDTAVFASLPYDEFVNSVTKYFFHPDDQETANDAMGELLAKGKASYEARLRRFDNRYIWAKIDLSLTLDEFNKPLCLVGYMSDIDDVKMRTQILENKVQTDPMTGLYNKVAMATLSNKVLMDNPNGLNALIVLDIDNFKGINDTLGHAFGDVVLIEVCAKLKTLFRNDDILGRIGGDEFAVLMKNVPDTSSVLKKAAEISGAFRQTYAGENGECKISCSMGIVMSESGKDRFENLYRKADAALYQGKQNGKDKFILYKEKDADSYPIESKRTNDEELETLKVSHNIEGHIFDLLYTSKDFNISINMALAAIGQQYHVSRVSIFENDKYDNTTSKIYEWCNEGVAPQIKNLQKLKISTEKGSIFQCFDKEGLLYCNDIRELPSYIGSILESQGVLSTLKMTIVNDDGLFGFIGFDECKDYRIWTSEEIEKLSFLARILSIFLFKEKAEATLLASLNTRLQILDTIPNYICVVNPENHCIEYANKKMKSLLPAAHSGAFCYTTLRGGQNSPCKTCLIERIKQGDTDNLEIISEDKSLCLKVNALTIKWSDNNDMVLLYGADAPTKK